MKVGQTGSRASLDFKQTHISAITGTHMHTNMLKEKASRSSKILFTPVRILKCVMPIFQS